MIKTVLGKKIKALRKANGLTQSDLAGNKFTRNMLSSIENGVASPSLDTLEYIAEGLGVSVSYLVSEDDDLSFYRKKEKMEKVYRAYEAKNFNACINLIRSIGGDDSELNYIYAYCQLELGKQNVAKGALITALKNLKTAAEYCEKTKIDTVHLKAQIPMYTAIANNVQSPLLEFDSAKYKEAYIFPWSVIAQVSIPFLTR